MIDDNFTQWIRGLADGDELAIQELWKQYYERLLRLARKWLGDGRHRVADEEDVALSALDSFCRGAAAGRFPHLDDPQDLRKLLLTITARKAIKQLKRHYAKKRGGGEVRGESAFKHGDSSEPDGGIDQVMDQALPPDLAAMLSEECERLLARLEDESLQEIALYKLENYTNEEIAQRVNCGVRTIKRRLARIREKWEKEGT